MAGTHSGVGKTTVATGLMAALRARGLRVASAKVGPDFIDPGYHALATGRPGHNLDSWMCGTTALPGLARRAAAGADLLVIEGVMGLFDGASWLPDGDRDVGECSTAEVALALDAPVLLVVDASAMSTSIAAVVHGYRSVHPRLRLAGVLCNRVGSPSHADALARALADLPGPRIPVVGMLGRDDRFTWRDRHLGLVPVVEQRVEVSTALDRLAMALAAAVDLDAVVRLARSPSGHEPATLAGTGPGPAPRAGDATDHHPGTSGAVTGGDGLLPTRWAAGARRVPIAVAGGRAFTFAYPDNLERLEGAGAELVPFDPLEDRQLPDGVAGLYAGGGFPEVYAGHLAANTSLLADVRAKVERGLVTWAECGGMLWMCETLDGNPLCGALPARASMTRTRTLGYRAGAVLRASPVAAVGDHLRGHEFHYSTVDVPGDALALRGRDGTRTEGFATPSLLATYLHLHLGADPRPAERFVGTAAAAAAAAVAGGRAPSGTGAEPAEAPGPPEPGRPTGSMRQ